MDGSSLKPQPVIAEVLPGFTVLAVLAAAYFYGDHERLHRLLASGSAVAAIGGAGLLVSWIVGTFLDAVGNASEELWDWWWPVNWKYLADGPAERVDRVNEWFLAYYLLDRNYVYGIAVLCLSGLLRWISLPSQVWIILIALLVVLVNDARFLRRELIELLGPTSLPHQHAHTRLAPSPRHGIGVMAIRPIKKGALVFAPDDDDTVKVPKDRTEQLPPEIKALYHDFCVLEDDEYECPVSFNKLTPAWYVNDCGEDEPNVAPDSDLKFQALRDIKAGEELLARYADYSENEQPA